MRDGPLIATVTIMITSAKSDLQVHDVVNLPLIRKKTLKKEALKISAPEYGLPAAIPLMSWHRPL